VRRNKKQRDTMPKSKKKESPVGTPINTPINTPERATSVANSFSALQADSDAEDKSVDTINAEEPQIEIESETDDVPTRLIHPKNSNHRRVKASTRRQPPRR
jgi:hypothetical protein